MARRKVAAELPAPVPASTQSPEREWTLLCYLCGDLKELAEPMKESLAALARGGASERLYVAVQWDRAEGARRFLIADFRGAL